MKTKVLLLLLACFLGINGSFAAQPTKASKAPSGRVIGYIPGWKSQLPSGQELSAAGYTHAIIAFGVFSLSEPGKIVAYFPTITHEYIDNLHKAGLKVLLSLGGASTELPDTTVNFHQVLNLAKDETQFQEKFIKSIQNLVEDYHFDGIDIDIEHGLNAGGTFSNPKGDIAVLANIINRIHTLDPKFLISLAPQAANIGATMGFSDPWGNYASLVMQIHNAVSWVGIQLYNTGCVYGIDQVCYPNNENSTNFSVAMATDLLENWPAKDATGRATGFMPYISYLRGDQIVLGYPAPNHSGDSDGRPATPTATIKKAIACLRTRSEACTGYKAPKPYGTVGGVFNWEVTYDKDNDFKFAKELKSCAIDGVCN